VEVSIDKLLGYVSQDRPITIYEETYKTQEYYWGTELNKVCYQVLQLLPPTRHLKITGYRLRGGKGRRVFARNGYDVSAFDISDSGIEKTKKLAEKTGVHINVFKADILDYRLDTHFDIIFSSRCAKLHKTGFP
jgi:tellurite methyltransferase